MTIIANSSQSDNQVGAVSACGQDARFSAALPERVSTPTCNTGVAGSHNSGHVVFSLDYLTFTVHAAYEAVYRLLDGLGLAAGLEYSGHGRGWYKELYEGLHGLNVGAVPLNGRVDRETGEILEVDMHCSVQIPGLAMQAAGLDVISELAYALAELAAKDIRVKVTRCDLTFDSQGFSVQDVVDADHAGLLSTRARRRGGHWDEKSGVVDGYTFEVGSRSSEAFMRIYYKTNGCSFGDGVPFTRVELELKDVRADLAFWEIVASERKEWARMAAQLVNGFMTIEAGWWQEFIGAAARSWLKLRRRVSTIASKMRYAYQASKSLSIVFDALNKNKRFGGIDFLNELVADGRRRRSVQEDKLVKYDTGDGLPTFEVFDWGSANA